MILNNDDNAPANDQTIGKHNYDYIHKHTIMPRLDQSTNAVENDMCVTIGVDLYNDAYADGNNCEQTPKSNSTSNSKSKSQHISMLLMMRVRIRTRRPIRFAKLRYTLAIPYTNIRELVGTCLIRRICIIKLMLIKRLSIYR